MNPKDKNQASTNSRLKIIQANFCNKEGQPIDFENRPYWRQIYAEDSRFVCLMTSRQMGKTLYETVQALTDAAISPGESILFASANADQLNVVRSGSVEPQLQNNKRFKQRALKKDSIKNSRQIKLSNQSSIYFRPIGNQVNSARGLSVSTIIFDEVQDIPRKNIDVVMESAANFGDKSKYIFGGTCKSESNLMYQLYLDTCQYEWIIPCLSCNEDNLPIGMKHIDPDLPFLFCCFCKATIDARQGSWIPQYPHNKRVGYRIPRLIDPNTQWRSEAFDGILDKYETYSLDKFRNEVMAIPSDTGANLITLEELKGFCTDTGMMDPQNVPESIRQRPVIAAVDWSVDMTDSSRSHTTISISRVLPGHIETLYMKRFVGIEYVGTQGPDKVLEEILALVGAFNVDIVISDHGVGNKENLRLRGRIGIKLMEIQYVSSSKPVIWDSSIHRYIAPKTETLDRFFNQLRVGRFKFPKAEVSMPFLNDLMNVYIRYDEQQRARYYDKSGKGPDDFVQLLNFTLIVAVDIYHSQFEWLRRYAFTG